MHPIVPVLLFILFGPTFLILYLVRRTRTRTMAPCMFFFIWSIAIGIGLGDVFTAYGSQNPGLTAFFLAASYLITSCVACYYFVNLNR